MCIAQRGVEFRDYGRKVQNVTHDLNVLETFHFEGRREILPLRRLCWKITDAKPTAGDGQAEVAEVDAVAWNARHVQAAERPRFVEEAPTFDSVKGHAVHSNRRSLDRTDLTRNKLLFKLSGLLEGSEWVNNAGSLDVAAWNARARETDPDALIPLAERDTIDYCEQHNVDLMAQLWLSSRTPPLCEIAEGSQRA